ncbi:MAG: serine/threonine-protein kinase [Acidobacteriota bacterium]|nr:MAG: serine/threonine-protein kinase [Acidobacteriota bacterium]
MDPELWKKIDELVDAALEVPEGRRADFVRESCGDDDELREKVLALVEAQKESESFLERSAMDLAAENLARQNAGTAFSYVGKTIGAYRVESLLGTGGMGEVYQAFDDKLKRNVALKILTAGLGGGSEPVKRFEVEARAISRLNHPGIVTIYDVGRFDGTNFIATELVEGRTIRDLTRGRVKVRDAVSIFIQVCGALSAAHKNGIIHRDIKPENLMLREDGYVKILDFGLAKLTEPDPGEEKLFLSTRKGSIIGTPAYMSPAQLSGEKIDHRTDLWSCGVVLYELLAGENPFKGPDRRATFSKILTELPPAPGTKNSEVPGDLDRVVMKLLEKNPSMGYQSADDLKADLKRIRREIDSSPFVSVSSGAVRYFRRRVFTPLRIAAGLSLAIIAGAAFYFLYPWGGEGTDWSNARSLQLTFQSGTEVYPSLSPDGSSFIYASDKDGDFDIYLLRIGGSNEVNLTESSEADDTMPSFSPDGSSIAFRSEREPSGIYVMGATGENPRRVADAGFDPAWSPDGKSIAIATRFQDVPAVRTPSAIWVVDINSGEKRMLIDNYAHQPSWSADGKRIAFWYTEDRGKRIVATIPSEGGEASDIASESNTNWNPRWSPAGNFLYYASDRGGNTGFWRVPVDTSSGKASGEHESVPTPAKFNRHPAFSSDGRRLIYVQTSARSNILTAPLGPGEKLSSEPKWLTRGDFEIAAPQILPDGSGFVARIVRETQDDLVFIDGSNGALNDLTNDPAFDRYARISPDGKKIAFASDRSGIYQIWLMNLDGSGLVKLTDTQTIASIPAWSPDGKMLSYDSSEQVFLLDMEKFATTGKAEVKMRLPKAANGGFFRVWDWSPDGKMVAGNFDLKAGSGVGVYRFESGEYKRLTDYTSLPSWMPDGRRLLFLRDGRPLFADIISGEITDAFPEIEGYVRNIAVSPDGKTVYFTLRESESNVWLLDAGEGSP